MTDYESLKHTKWECKYHVIFIPKWRKKRIYGQLRKDLGSVLRELARQKESQVEEGHLMADHVHMLVSIPPKYSVAQVVEYIKGRALSILRERIWESGRTLWARISGHEDILFQRSAEIKLRFGNT
jgi:putative transposase